MSQSVEGDLPFFEGAKVSKRLSRQVLGPWRFLGASVLIGIVAVSVVFGVCLVNLPILQSHLLPTFLIYAVLVIGAAAALRRPMRGLIRKRWLARGVPERTHIVFRVTDEGFRVEAETATTQVPWRYVSELALDEHYWLLIVAGMSYFVPRRFFTGSEQERAFAAAVLARLQPAALARSRRAEVFAAGYKG